MELYHYTSLEAFKSIIESSIAKNYIVLRATDSGYLNDTKEGLYCKNEEIKKRFKKFEEDGLDNDRIRLSENLEDFHLAMLTNCTASYSYIMCFSEERDCLPMWQSYANAGAGVSLVFNVNSTVLEEFNCLNGGGASLEKCTYTSEDVERSIKDEDIKDFYDLFQLDSNNRVLPKGLGSSGFFYKILAIKSQAFNYEKEWRLVFRMRDNGFDQIDYQLKDNILKPFVNIKIPKSMLKGVILGPSSNGKLNLRSIKKLTFKSDFCSENDMSTNMISQGNIRWNMLCHQFPFEIYK